MAAKVGIEAHIQVIDQNPETSQGKSMNSERDNTAEVMSKAIQSQVAAMLPTMIHETLAKKSLEGTASSSQTLNISSISLPRLAAGSTQGLNDGHVEISDPPSKKTEVSEANEDVSEDLTHPAGRWEASEELSSFLDVRFADKPLSVYERKQITKDFPRPNVESVFTPVLDDYLSSLVTGAKGVDKEAKKFQDQLLDIVGPVSMAFEHISNWHESEDNPAFVILSTQDVGGLYTWFVQGPYSTGICQCSV